MTLDKVKLTQLREFAAGVANNNHHSTLLNRWLDFDPDTKIHIWIENPQAERSQRVLHADAHDVVDGVVGEPYDIFYETENN